MYLSKLEIRGFKSFKDKEVLEFPPEFSTVIGPNGSGKTNIVDAICFVLGSSRNLRVKHIEELICNGGTNSEKSASAKVSIYLKENESKKRIKISREIDREGKSEYKLDGKKVRREEIIELLGDNEYNIIHQNDITRIIDMKPGQRREMIDDLCGLREYEQKKEKAMKELSKVEEKFSQTNIVLGEKRGYLEGLKGERDEALRYREISQKLKSCKATIIKDQLEKDRQREEKIRQEIDSVQKDKDTNVLRIKKLKDEINEKTVKVRESNQDILRLEKSLEDEEILQLREEYVRGEGELGHLKNDLQSLEEELTSKQEKRGEIAAEKEPLANEIKKIQQQLDQLKPRMEALGKSVKGLEAGEGLQELKSNLTWLRSSTDRNLEKVEGLEEKREDSDNRLKELSSQKIAFSQDYEKGRKEGERLATELDRERDNLREIAKEKIDIEPALESLQGKLAQKKAELEALQKSPSKGAVAKAIMNVAAVVKGIHGTAQELGTPDSRYEKALSIASGSRIYAMAVKDEETAKKCINYLRKKKIGRATFLPLNKLQVRTRDKSPKEALGFAREFVNCRPEFKPVFKWVFGDTLVIRDIDVAKRIGLGKWPMVTLEGDLISTAGAISGGYVKAKKVFSTDGEIRKEISALEKKIVKLTGQREDQRTNEGDIRRTIQALEEAFQEGETRREKIKLNLESLQERISSLRQDIQEYRNDLTKLGKEIKKNEGEANKLQKKIDRSERDYRTSGKEEAVEELTALEEQYHQFSMKDGSLQEKSKYLAQRLLELKNDLGDLAARKEDLLKRGEQTKQKISRIKKKLEERKSHEKGIEQQVSKLIDARTGLEQDISSLGEKIGRIEYELDSGNEKLNRRMVKKAKIETRVTDLEKEFENYQDIEFLEGKISELEQLVEELGREIAGFGFINMRAIDNYQTVKKELDEMDSRLETLRKEKQSILNFMEKVEKKKREIFMEAFNEVKKNFEEIFQELGSGKGTLKLDHVNELSKAGLVIRASPGGKKLISLDMMSGGEKVLTCSAFLLAIQKYKPSYFYVLDELDAALDRRNSLKLAEMLKNSEAQFILVTHNDSILKYAKTIIGISMQDGLSQVVGVKLTE